MTDEQTGPGRKRRDEGDWPGKTIDFEEFSAELERRRAALGYPEMPRNEGKHRTASKRALLRAIEEAGGKW